MDKKFDKYELAALEVAGQRAGKYLESINKFDVTKLTRDEWNTFLKTIYGNTCSEISNHWDNDIPF